RYAYLPAEAKRNGGAYIYIPDTQVFSRPGPITGVIEIGCIGGIKPNGEPWISCRFGSLGCPTPQQVLVSLTITTITKGVIRLLISTVCYALQQYTDVESHEIEAEGCTE